MACIFHLACSFNNFFIPLSSLPLDVHLIKWYRRYLSYLCWPLSRATRPQEREGEVMTKNSKGHARKIAEFRAGAGARTKSSRMTLGLNERSRAWNSSLCDDILQRFDFPSRLRHGRSLLPASCSLLPAPCSPAIKAAPNFPDRIVSSLALIREAGWSMAEVGRKKSERASIRYRPIPLGSTDPTGPKLPPNNRVSKALRT